VIKQIHANKFTNFRCFPCYNLQCKLVVYIQNSESTGCTKTRHGPQLRTLEIDKFDNVR